jgi:hypothetical protein
MRKRKSNAAARLSSLSFFLFVADHVKLSYGRLLKKERKEFWLIQRMIAPQGQNSTLATLTKSLGLPPAVTLGKAWPYNR